MEKVSSLLIYAGGVVGVGAFGYKMVQKGRQKYVPTIVDTAMYVGLGALAIGVALKFAVTKKVSVA